MVVLVGAFPPGTLSYVYLSSVSYYSDPNIANATYTYQAPNIPSYDYTPLLSTCNDPMYDGPMKRISYTYQTTPNLDGTLPVYGQIRSENYPGGPAVSTLTVGQSSMLPGSTIRTETRADGKGRTFTYSADGYLSSWTDFMNHSAWKGYDANKYVNSFTDARGANSGDPSYTTNFTRDALTGNITVITYPLTQGDTPGQTQRPTVQYTYGWSGCADANNRDATKPYWVCTGTDEGGHVTQFLRDGNHRVTRINYPDGGYETFSYNSFGEVLNHQMTSGGIENFTYDGRGLKLTYRNPDTANTVNPTARYGYDLLDRVTDITDVLGTSLGDGNHSTSFTYNGRGQVLVTTLPKDINNGNSRHTITNFYNPDGTLQYRTDELGTYPGDPAHTTNYTYDDYRRIRSVILPDRGDNHGTHTTSFYYDANGTGEDYQYTDSNATYVKLPSGKTTKTTYDENRRKSTVTVGYGSGDDAITTYGYDKAGNLTSVKYPLNHSNVTNACDERNRPSSVSMGSQTTTFNYDTSGRRNKVTRPNGQDITYDTFDLMNRVTQQTATQNPDPAAVTKYAYYLGSGLLYTMQDPRLVATNSTYKYTYGYDAMGRKTSLQYPPDSFGIQRTEQYSYDTSGRLWAFTNRNSKTQTFIYDALNRMTDFSWNDGLTPSVHSTYDQASRLTGVTNKTNPSNVTIADISRSYYNDNLLHLETESITGAPVSKTVTYTYDADGNRSSTQYPDNSTYNYTYTGRNQLQGVTNFASYAYDTRGNLTTRTISPNDPGHQTQSTYLYDDLDRVTQIAHSLNGTTRTLNYGYYDNSYNRKFTQRLGTVQGNIGDVFGYDLADQATAVRLNITNPDSTAVGGQTILYDTNGNRTTFRPYGGNNTYTTNNLNQYTARSGSNATYDVTGNLAIGFDSSTYQYDAQNRLLTAYKSGTTETFTYDGLNRQVSRSVTGQPTTTTYNVYDGWNLIEEYQAANQGATTASYLYGTGGLIVASQVQLNQVNYYYQDGSGSTSHLANASGQLQEWYRYDLHGTPVFYNSSDQQIGGSAFGVRHLFTGQQWYAEVGLYDLRNRVYSPDIGRFLQPDPIGFDGDPTNLYRYCGNNPLVHADPTGEYWGYVIVTGIIIGAIIYERWYYSTHPATWTGCTYPETPPNSGIRQEVIKAYPAPEEAPPPDDDWEIQLLYTSISDDGGGADDNGGAGAEAGRVVVTAPPVSAPDPYWRSQGFQPGLWYPGMSGAVPFGQGGLSVIGGMFDFGGTSIGGTFGGDLSFTNAWGAYTNPMGSMGLCYGGCGSFNFGGAAGGWERALEGGKGPKDH